MALPLAAIAIGTPTPDDASAAPHAATPPPAGFGLTSQSEWVVAAGRPPQSSPFDLGLTVGRAPSGATVKALLYPRLRSRFAFKTEVHSGPRGAPLAATTPVAVTSLPGEPQDAGAISLDLSVVQTASSGVGTRLGLACLPPTGTGTCTGVYPVEVELQRADGRVLHRFTTFLTYVAGKSAHPLELAWVVPIDSPVTTAAHPSGPATSIEPPTAADASALERLVSELRTAAVPLSLDVSPETLQQLERAGPDGRAADAALAAISVNRPSEQVLTRPYVPIDLGALAGAGERTEIVAQMAAGATVLRGLHVVATTSASPWVQPGTVGNDIAGGLEAVGSTELVVSSDELAPTANATNVGTWTSTFSLALSHGGSTSKVEAAETDSWLDGQFASHRDDPALAASQFLADLAMVHFERPNTTAVRGMVALPPAGWVADATFDRVLLAGLVQNPVVEPVTLAQFFTSVSTDGTRKLLTSRTGPVLGRALARKVSDARARLSDFDESVRGHAPVLSELDDLLLASESESLSARRQAAGVSSVERLLDGQLRLVSFATKTTFTLTARTGWIPITVESRANYTVVGTLAVSGAKFQFPHASTRRTFPLDQSTNLWRVDVVARTSGDLPLDVTFTSPDGRLVIARGTLTVRSTATSVVGVVLTVVALAVLLIWWARTWRSGRRRRRLQRAGTAASAAAVS